MQISDRREQVQTLMTCAKTIEDQVRHMKFTDDVTQVANVDNLNVRVRDVELERAGVIGNLSDLKEQLEASQARCVRRHHRQPQNHEKHANWKTLKFKHFMIKTRFSEGWKTISRSMLAVRIKRSMPSCGTKVAPAATKRVPEWNPQ